MNESGRNTVQQPPKVFKSKGKKQVGAVISAERGEHFTVVACANVIRNFPPPAIIIPRKNHKAEYFDGALSGTLKLCYTTGYMVASRFNRLFSNDENISSSKLLPHILTQLWQLPSVFIKYVRPLFLSQFLHLGNSNDVYKRINLLFKNLLYCISWYTKKTN
ncbi:hypothetical protein RN001_004825 [Aquatica leii]|uniref:Uncharacterized protein n=1 Tax=Aquatica leii TaxID=1421715 RepID=A0AAN7SA95_9COLE|nr:hypothetical protein RN001_004825 [Aquatica leii]